ncbi:MAG: RsmB/NOP family class I SAM-dependent RNA methyltransferase [Ruegeria sp.]
MTPAARIQASIEILDEYLSGMPVEKALTGWARRSRFAGSKDRAAVRDHVFDALRCRRSFAALGGTGSGRGLMIGAQRAAGGDPNLLFTGDRHAPDILKPSETARDFASEADRLDIPEWLWPEFESSLGREASAAARALQSRAPVHLRVNQAKGDREQAASDLAGEGVQTRPHPVCDTALVVTEGARKVAQSRSYRSGLVELQDAASQAVVAALPLRPGMRVLDYCAGGGGKALAIAARPECVQVFAHDANPDRMRDLPIRAERAGAKIEIVTSEQLRDQAAFDVVLTDVPCSGSGSWRRSPAGKWALTRDRLDSLAQTQLQILRDVEPFVAEGGVLAYATCSMLSIENDEIIDAFVAERPEWGRTWRKQWRVSEGTDGFYSAHLVRKN